MKQYSLTTKIILSSLVVVVFTSLMIGTIFYYGNNRNIIKQETENLVNTSKLIVPIFENAIDTLKSDMKKLSRYPEIIDASIKSDDESIRLMEKQLEFFSCLTAKLQDDKNRNAKKIKGSPFLQNAAGIINTSRFEKDIEWTDSKIHPGTLISEITLEKIGGEVVSPHRPILKASAFTRFGSEKVAHIEVKIQLNKLFDKMSEIGHEKLFTVITNHHGDYLIGPNPANVFGFEHGLKFRVNQDYEGLDNFFDSYPVNVKLENIKRHPGKSLFLTKIILNDSGKGPPFITIGQLSDYKWKIDEFNSLRTKTVISSLLIILLVSLGMLFFGKHITRDLLKITEMAQRYTRGEEDIDLKITSEDEIGVLAKTFQGMIYQVTERTRRIKRSEAKSRKAKEIAEEATRVKTKLLEDVSRQKEKIEKISKEKDDLMAIVSHDLKNPLATIETSMNIIEDDNQNLNDEQNLMVRRTKSSAKFSLQLIRDLLDLARLEGGIKLEKKDFSMGDLIKECIEAYELTAEQKKVNLFQNIKTDMLVNADFPRVAQVINNLIGNAIKFTPVDGKIVVKAYPEEDQESVIHIEVSDTGRGIPKEMQDKIFNKYEQAKSKDRETGTGLGLAICKNILQLHGGDIFVESYEGQGSTFHIMLPGLIRLIKDSEALFSVPNKIQTPLRLMNPPSRILIVDDSEDTHNLLKVMLKGENVEIVSAFDGKEATRIYAESPFEVVLMDMNMPVMNGIKATQIIRAWENKKELRKSTIFAITANDDIETIKTCLESGFDDAFCKPFKKDNLLEVLGFKKDEAA